MKGLFVGLLCGVASLAHAQILSTFDTDADGWTTTNDAKGFPVPEYVASGGNDGGFIRATDNLGGVYFYFVAPAKFTGDLSGYIGDTLYFDMYFNVTGESAPSQSDVTITGGGLTLVTNLFTAGPADTWIRRAIPLTASGGWRKSSVTGSFPSEPEFLIAMSNVTELRVKGEYTTLTDITGLDNVLFGSILTLPVELAGFTASAFSSGVKLVWSTKTEQNNAGFEVERKTTGNWTSLGFVAGKGTTNNPQSYSFIDAAVSGKASYRLKQVDTDGAFSYSPVVEFTGTPATFEVLGNYPNPFNPATVIKFNLPAEMQVTVSVFNVLGQRVAELVNGKLTAGEKSVSFNAAGLSSGVYIYRIQAGNQTVTRSMLLTK